MAQPSSEPRLAQRRPPTLSPVPARSLHDDTKGPSRCLQTEGLGQVTLLQGECYPILGLCHSQGREPMSDVCFVKCARTATKGGMKLFVIFKNKPKEHVCLPWVGDREASEQLQDGTL